MRALVTGGAGFIGSALVERLLAAGDTVDAVDDLSTGSIARLADARRHGGSFRFHQLDVCQAEFPALVDRRKPEVIYHLAAVGGLDRGFARATRDAEVSIVGTLKLLEAAARSGVRKVVYGVSAPLAAPVASGAGLHDLAERAALSYLERFREQRGLEFTALAVGCVYGPGRADPGPVARLAAAALGRRVSDAAAAQLLDLVYLDDAVDAFVRAGVRGSGLVVAISAGCVVSSAQLGRALEEIVAGQRPVLAEVGTRAPAASRARLHLGWEPFTPLAVGLAAVIAASGAERPMWVREAASG